MRLRPRLVCVLALLLFALTVQPAFAMFQPAKDIGGDWREDTALMYDYGNGGVGFWAFDSYNAATLNVGSPQVKPRKLWRSPAGWGTASKMTPMLADVTGDGKADIVSAYAYGPGQMGFWVVRGTPSSSYPTLWWKSSVTGWAPGKTKLTVSESLSGAGPSSPIALYDYGNGRVALWVFAVGSGSTFAPHKYWESAAGTWTWAKCKIAGGDFDRDGKGDVVVLYDYGNATTGLWLFKSTGSGYVKTLAWKSAPATWWWDRSTLLAEDVDDDGRDEAVVLYRSSDGKTKFWVFQEDAGKMLKQDWGSSIQFPALPTTLSDVSGDGNADLVTFGPGTEDMGVSFEMLPSTGSAFPWDNVQVLWESPEVGWTYGRARLVP